MRPYRFFHDVREMPLMFNLLGFRVTMPVILILLANVIVPVVILVIADNFLSDDAFVKVFIAVTIIALLFAFTVLWWVSRLTRMGPLAVEKQLRLLRDTSRLPVWTGLDYIDNDSKEQIR